MNCTLTVDESYTVYVIPQQKLLKKKKKKLLPTPASQSREIRPPPKSPNAMATAVLTHSPSATAPGPSQARSCLRASAPFPGHHPVACCP